MTIAGEPGVLPLAKKLQAVSLFSGAGGLDFGLTSVGVNVRCASDIEDYACDTLRRNYPDTVVIGPPSHDGDIKGYQPSSFLREANLKIGDVDILVGGPPCQSFSIAANQRFLKGDHRFKRQGYADEFKGGLIESFLKFVAHIQPQCFLMENVPGIVEIDGGTHLRKLLATVHNAGYKTSEPAILDAENFGIPQRRRRCFVLGVKGCTPPLLPKSSWDLPGFRYPRGRTVADALLGIPENCSNHITRNHALESVARYRTLKFGQRERLGRVDRLDPWIPSKTIIAGGSNGGGRSHLHPFIARTLTVRESARLQSFPDTYIFSGSIARQFTQVGNAVPPYLASQLAFFIVTAVFGIKADIPIAPAFLRRRLPVDRLCRELWEESLERDPNRIYLDSSKCFPEPDDLFVGKFSKYA